MASDSPQPPPGSQARAIIITIAIVGMLLLTCGLSNLVATIWGFGRVGQAPAQLNKEGKVELAQGAVGKESTLPTFVKKDARIKFEVGLNIVEGTVREVHGSWVLMRDVRNKNGGVARDELNTWINFGFAFIVDELK